MLCTAYASAQKSSSHYEKFGKISAEDLQTKLYSIDSSANAVILSDIANYEIEGNSNGWFSLKLSRHAVIHILNKNGYDEANIEIPLYVSDQSEEEITAFKAVTYNLENKKVSETKLSRKDLVQEQVDENHLLVKFTMPQVREGSIIEFSYEVASEYISMPDPWYFQSTTAPTLWSEVTFAAPEFFIYRMLTRGYFPVTSSDKLVRRKDFTVRETRMAYSSDAISIKTNVTYFHFISKDVPQLKTEPYTRSLRNHLSRIEFQLISQRYPLSPKNYKTSWEDITKGMLESDYFGDNLNTSNNWMKDELRSIIGNEADPLTKAYKIYAYIRDGFTTTSPYGLYMSGDLKNVFKTKKGNVSEINLLLTAMLRAADLNAAPVMLSTSLHGYAVEYIPMLSSMNYVITKLKTGGKVYFLDASRSLLGFGRLPEYCYNGYACTVNEQATPVTLSPDSLVEKRRVLFVFGKGDDGFAVSVKRSEGYYHSLDIRNEVSDEGMDEFRKGLEKGFSSQVSVSDLHIDSLKNYETPLKLRYTINMENNGEDILYINPLFGEKTTKNPFSAADRKYPVEMPYVTQETIYSSIYTPKGYTVDEAPKSIFVKLDSSGQTYFKYLISRSGGVTMVQSQLKIGKTFFMPEEYAMLRAFFNLVTKKQNEQIVFKKTKL